MRFLTLAPRHEPSSSSACFSRVVSCTETIITCFWTGRSMFAKSQQERAFLRLYSSSQTLSALVRRSLSSVPKALNGFR